MNDSEKLRTLATWFDYYDSLNVDKNNITSKDVQTDLRRIADRLDVYDAKYPEFLNLKPLKKFIYQSFFPKSITKH